MVKKLLAVVTVMVVVVIGVVAYSFLRTPEEASGSIEAIPIAVQVDELTVAQGSNVTTEATDSSAEEVEPAVVSEPQTNTTEETDITVEPQAQAEVEGSSSDTDVSNDTGASGDTSVSHDTDAATPAEEEVTNAAETETASSSAEGVSSQEMAASPIVFEIVPAESRARFLIDEVLRGNPITVVGATDQVAGQLAVDADDLSNTQVGVIQVNARTLATDNDFRNRAIKNRILLTDDYEFVTFAPTEVIGLPEVGAVGETYTFQVAGDLTITDVTRLVTFDVTTTPTSETRIEGTATTAFPYTDFELFIPDAPAVDTVDDVVRLELEFVAEAIK